MGCMQVPLFYRFIPEASWGDTGLCPAGIEVPGTYTERVIREIGVLLNTRAPFSSSVQRSLGRETVLGYGLADFLHLSPSSRSDGDELGVFVKTALRAFEPRLMVGTVVVETPRARRDSFRAVITGTCISDDAETAPSEITFSIEVDSKQ